MTPLRLRGTCPECGFIERLRPDGTMVQHTRRWRVCKGTGREPVAGSVAAWLDAQDAMARAGVDPTWIDEVILDSYCALHAAGHAHSVECWDADGLQGGLYGVALPGVFFGESMFSLKTDASKIALVALVERLREKEFSLLDTQWMTSHLRQFGGYELSRKAYLAVLRKALD